MPGLVAGTAAQAIIGACATVITLTAAGATWLRAPRRRLQVLRPETPWRLIFINMLSADCLEAVKTDAQDFPHNKAHRGQKVRTQPFVISRIGTIDVFKGGTERCV